MAAHFDIIAHIAASPRTSPVMARVCAEFLRREANLKETADSINVIRQLSIERYIIEQRCWASHRGIRH